MFFGIFFEGETSGYDTYYIEVSTSFISSSELTLNRSTGGLGLS